MKIPYMVLKSLSLFLFFFVVLAACKDDKKEPEPDQVDDNPIVGTWQLISITPEVPGTKVPAIDFAAAVAPCYTQLKLTFNNNNTITAADCPAAVTAIEPFVPVGTDARWKVSGDKLTLSRGTTSQDFKMTQTATDLTVVVNTTTDATKPAVNVLLNFKRV